MNKGVLGIIVIMSAIPWVVIGNITSQRSGGDIVSGPFYGLILLLLIIINLISSIFMVILYDDKKISTRILGFAIMNAPLVYVILK